MENEVQYKNLNIPLPVPVANALYSASVDLCIASKHEQSEESVALGLIISGLVMSKYLTKKEVRKLGIKI